VDNPYNMLLVDEIKREIGIASYLEAFLESGLQLIIQFTFLIIPKIEQIR